MTPKTDYKLLSDSELVSLLKEGNHSAFTEIYSRYHHLMIKFAHRKLNDKDLTKDFVQDLFTNLWFKREEITESGNLAAYLYVTLRNKILDYFKHHNVQTKYIEALKHAFSTVSYTQADYLARERSLNEYIERQILSLPEKMRVVFQMSRKEHLSHKQIAQKLNTSEENIAQHITRALRTLKTNLTIRIF